MALTETTTRTDPDTIVTFEEQIGMDTYTRIDVAASDISLAGKRVPGYGKIEAVTNPVGEHHPSFVRFDDSEAVPSLEELKGCFDGRHTFIISEEVA